MLILEKERTSEEIKNLKLRNAFWTSRFGQDKVDQILGNGSDVERSCEKSEILCQPVEEALETFDTLDNEVNITGVVDNFSTDSVNITGVVDNFSTDDVNITGVVDNFSSDNVNINGAMDNFSSDNVNITGAMDNFSTDDVNITGAVENISTDNVNITGAVEKFQVLEIPETEFNYNNYTWCQDPQHPMLLMGKLKPCKK